MDSLPKRLVEYAEEVQHEGGIQSLHDMLQKIQVLSRKTTSMIEEGFNALEEENEQDATLSNQFGKCKYRLIKRVVACGLLITTSLVWTRPSSRSLTHNLLSMGTQYNDTIQAAQKADRIVQAKVTNWGKAIAMLSKNTDEIQLHLPTLQDDEEYYSFIIETLVKIRTQLNLLHKEIEARELLEIEVNDVASKDDITSALIARANELTKGSPTYKLEPEQFSNLFEERLIEYKIFEDRMKEHITSQNNILHAIQDLYGQFSYVVANKPILNKREKAITNLESAFTKFKEIRTNLVEGIKVMVERTT